MYLNFLPRCAEADCIPGMDLQTCPSEVCGQPQNGKDDGGLSCTVRPQEATGVAGAQAEIDVLEDFLPLNR